MSTLLQLVTAAARRLPGVVQGLATGGSTTTLEDTQRLTAYNDDEWIGGWLLLPDDGLVLVIADSLQSTGRLVFSAIAEAVASGDAYVLLPNRYDPYAMAYAIQEGLSTLAEMPAIDETLSGDGDSQSFTLPTAVAAGEVRRIWVLDDPAEDPLPAEIVYWEQREDGTLWTVVIPDDGATLRLQYVARPSIDPTTWTDTLTPDDGAVAEFVRWYAVMAAHRSQIGQLGIDDDVATTLMNFALEMTEQQRGRINTETLPKETFFYGRST